MDFMARAFWILTALSIPAAFLVDAGIARWLAIGWLGLVGAGVSLGNWATLVSNAWRDRHGSMVPIFGGALLAAALFAASTARTGRLMILWCFVDPWLGLIVLAPVVAAARWVTRRRS
jgi:hypothetical protein